MNLDLLLQCMQLEDASDLHLAVGSVPVFRVHGVLRELPQCAESVHAEGIREVVLAALGEGSWQKLEREQELDAAFSGPGGIRLRLNGYREENGFALAIRFLPNAFFALPDLGLPLRVLEDCCRMQSGLVLVTGSTGSGKSTTIASLVHRINQERACHIHTIEDPIEYRHTPIKAFVTQREVGRDTVSFAEALRRSLRQDPDVIVVGEMRDLDTMSAALTLAETGHLTFATLHTSDAAQTISRVISAFPAAQQAQVRVQLASTLRVIISQKLLPCALKPGRKLAAEVLVATPSVRAMIREGKTHQLQTALQTGGEHGMQTLNQSILRLVNEGHIPRATALEYAEDKAGLAQQMR